MGDIRVLQDQLELGVPIEDSMLLAGYTFEEIESREEDEEIEFVIKQARAIFTSKHLIGLNAIASEKPQVAQWLLERVVPGRFSQGHKIVEAPKLPKSIRLVGVYPDDNGTSNES